MTEKFGGEALRIYSRINRAGRKAIDEQAVTEFLGFNEDLKNTIGAVVRFDQASEKKINETIISKLAELEEKLGAKMLLANRDYPTHSTILLGAFDDKKEKAEKREGIFADLINDENLRKNLSELAGQKFAYKYLLLDKANLILTADVIPEAIFEKRKTLKKEYEQKGLRAVPMENILHISLSRITDLPENSEAMREYKKEIIKIRHLISSNPLELTVEKIDVIDIYSLLVNKKI